LAVQVENNASIVLIDLVPSTSPTSAHTYEPSPTVLVADGPPSDIAFVTTASSTGTSIQLAALVPSQNELAVIDPDTGSSSDIDLGAPFQHLSIVTSEVGATAAGSDIALVWSESSAEIAFVSLDSVGTPYRAVQQLSLEQPVKAILDVPPSASGGDPLKILVGADNTTFFVLDLVARTASPIVATSNTMVTPAPTGNRLWLYSSPSDSLASLDLTTLHPTNFALSHQVDAAFDVVRSDGGRAVVAVGNENDVSLTVIDSTTLTMNSAVTYGGVLLGGLP
jgi:hypothetical protein